MSWTDNLGKIAKGVVDFTGIPGLIHDLSNTLSNEDPWYVDAVNIAKDVAKIGTTPVRAGVKGLLAVGQKSYETGGILREKMEQTLLDTPLMYNKFKNVGESYDQYRMRVAENKDKISLGQATLSLLSPGKNAGDRSGWFQDWADNNLKFLAAGFDLFNEADRQAAFSDQYLGKFLSGTQDLVASSLIDPLTFTGFLGKGAVIASKGTMLDNINGRVARAVFGKFAMTNDKMDNLLTRALDGEGKALKDVEFLANTDAKGQYGYWSSKKVTNPDAMAYLFGKASTPEEVVQTFRAVMLKDAKSTAELAAKDPERALVLDNIQDVPHPQRQLLDGKLDGDVLVTPEYNKSVSTYIEDLKTNDPVFLEAYNKVATGRPFRYGFESAMRQESRFGAVSRAEKMAARTFAEPQQITFLKTSLHPLVKIGHYFTEDMPSGVFNVNDANSYMEFNTFLRQVNDLSGGRFRESSKELADRYLSTITPNDRLDIIKEAEQRALKTMFPNYTQETLDKIYRIYDLRRATLIERHNNQGFLGYFDGDQFINVKSPLLERQGANSVVIMDLARLKNGIDAHERVLPGLLQGLDVDQLAVRTQKTAGALDTINDIFKTSVLMRLGYTVRNLTEAQLSMMAKGFALPGMIAANGKEGVQRFFANRRVDYNRLADNVVVALGRADDRRVLQHEVASAIDMLRSVDMGRKQLARAVAERIGEIEAMRTGKYVKGQVEKITSDIAGETAITTGQAEEFAFERELKTLKSVLADLESEVLYHGSANPAFNLSNKRPLSASASKWIAEDYAGTRAATYHSVENYIPTKTGKPGKLTDMPGAPSNVEMADARLREVQRNLDQAKKQLAQTGKTQWDVPLLESQVQRYSDELKKAKSKLKGAVKRQDILDESMLQLKSDMIDAVNAGKKVEVRDGTRWREVKHLDLNTLIIAAEDGNTESIAFRDMSHRPVFRIRQAGGSVAQMRVYGRKLDLSSWDNVPLEVRESLFGNKVSNYKAWAKARAWRDETDPIYAYLRDNGYGSAKVLDDARAGDVSHIVLPDAIGDAGRERAVATRLAEVPTPQGALPAEGKLQTAAERRAARKNLRRAERIKQEYAVSPYYTQDNITAMINNGIEDAAANFATQYAQGHAYLDDLIQRLGGTITRAESNSIKQRIGYGTMTFDAGGHTYELPKAFEGASWFLSRTSADQSWNALVSSQEMAFTAGIGSRTVRTIDPTDPRYFEGWANILNMHFRDPETGIMDPVVRRILDGEDNAKILSWFRTHDGMKYAKEAYTMVGEGRGVTKLTGGELDEHLAQKLSETREAVQAYIPDNETALLLSAAKEDGKPLSGGDIEKWLTERFGKTPEKLQPLNGMLITSSKEYKDQERIIDTINRRVMRFLGALPEDVFARHPLVSTIYDRELRLNIAAMADAKGADRLTAEEVNRAIADAREFARQEVERTLFTIIRRTGASSSRSMKLMFPFFAAYENTIKRWSGMTAENPMIMANAARSIAQVVNGQMVVDQNGNRITDAKALSGATSTANLVVRVPKGFIDKLPKEWRDVVNNAFQNINIPLASLDVITQGQPGNPGFGPFATLPTYLIVRDRPELEDALRPFFPVGLPQSATDIFTPSVLRRLSTVWRQDALYVRTYNQMLRYETYKYNQGKRTDEPTPTEIKDKTNKFFFLRALTSITAPFAISPEMDFYAQTFRQLQSQYADYKDPATGQRVYGMAETKFLEMYPDFFEATVSLSKNEGGLEPSVQTVRNLRKYSDLMAYADGKGDPELIGFLANDGDNQYTFSQAAYQWQYRHGATPGAGSAYRQNRTPGELLREANIKRGWTEFQQIQAAINTYKIQNGIESDNDPQMQVVKQAKSLWVQSKAKENLDWYSEYVSPDRAKYERRAEILDKALADKKWMADNGERPIVKSIALYLDARKQIAKVLDARDAAGGSRSLAAQSNADIAEAFDMFKTNLIAGSNEMEQFLNRYFANDTVVI